MDPLAAGQPTTPASNHPGVTSRTERRCVLFGCLDRVAWIVSEPQGGELPACEIDVDMVLNDALGRVPLDRDVRVEIRRA